MVGKVLYTTFSDHSAHLIAAMETIRAENQGRLAEWGMSGMVEEQDWYLSANHNDCGDNGDDGPHPIDEARRNCRTIPAVSAA